MMVLLAGYAGIEAGRITWMAGYFLYSGLYLFMNTMQNN
jgi:hypothetical protein